MSFIGLLLTIILLFITPLIIPNWHITVHYYYLFPHFLLFLLFSVIYQRSGLKPSPLLMSIACFVFYLLLGIIFIGISVFPYPDTPQIFLTVLYFLIPTLMILHPSFIITITIICEVVYLVLALQFKTSACVEQDVFNSFASILFSSVVTFTINRLRIQDYHTRTKLQLLSMTDRLTNLLNKGSFEGECTYILENTLSTKCRALVILDLDDFCYINNNYSHQCGDEVLIRFGAMLKQYFPEPNSVGRIGGDEFAVFIPSTTGMKELQNRIQNFQREIPSIRFQGESIVPSCSVGAVVTSSQSSYDDLYRLADTALYNIKETNKGKNRIVVS